MKIVVFLCESNEANYVFERIVKDHSVSAVVNSSKAMDSSTAFRLVRKMLKEGGWSFFVRKSIAVFGFRILSKFNSISFGLSKSARAIADENDILLLSTENINNHTMLECLSKLDADLFVSIHFDQILKDTVISLPKIGTLNVHGSYLPKNRGLFPYYWVLTSPEDPVGVTVHWINIGIDTGKVMKQIEIERVRGEGVFQLARRQAVHAAELLSSAITELKEGRLTRKHQVGKPSYGSWPTRKSAKLLKKNRIKFGAPLAPIKER